MKQTYFLSSLGVFCVLFWIAGCGASRPAPTSPEREAANWKSCRIVPEEINPGVTLEIVITDHALIEKITGKPVRDAKVDPAPAKYLVLATMEMESADGGKDSFVLFHPLGHFKRIGTQDYRIADFSEMRKLLRTAHDAREWKLLLGEK
jgi:hypothetical protein